MVLYKKRSFTVKQRYTQVLSVIAVKLSRIPQYTKHTIQYYTIYHIKYIILQYPILYHSTTYFTMLYHIIPYYTIQYLIIAY